MVKNNTTHPTNTEYGGEKKEITEALPSLPEALVELVVEYNKEEEGSIKKSNPSNSPTIRNNNPDITNSYKENKER